MATKQNKEKAELVEIKNLLQDSFNLFDQKLDEVKAELKQDITAVKAELKQDITEIKSELKQDITAVKAELKQEIATTRSELKQDISDVKGDIKALHVEVKGLEKRLSNVENSAAKIPEITEKFGELKNWRQTAFVIIAGVVSAFLGWIARGGKL